MKCIEFETTLFDLASLPPEPVHLAEVRWFQIDRYSLSSRERRAIFFKDRVCWSHHPWGARADTGCDFIDQWTLETRYPQQSDSWSPDGRVEGWSLRLYHEVYSSPAEAAAEVKRIAVERRQGLHKEIAGMDRVIADVEGILLLEQRRSSGGVGSTDTTDGQI